MSVSLLCMSHTPLMAFNDPGAEARAAVDGVLERARAFVAEVDPTLVVSFGPDHYNGFFYDLMPPFAVCYAGEGVGDFDTQAGPFNVPVEIADGLARHALAAGIDMAISRGAQLDHGAVQLPELVFGSIDRYPTVPVFVNGVSEPFGPVRRVREMGAALGDYLRTLDERVLVIGSGGLSHDPPVPRWAEATQAQRSFLLAGRNPTAEARAARQARTLQAGLDFAAGLAPLAPLNPDWDEQFLDICASGDLTRFDAWTPEEMTAAAGHSAHEVRCWIAAFAALAAAGPYAVTDRFYRQIPEWIAGFGFLTARTN
jgi:2,3-dihydroxyphenylpropionate 1,2-dioxygenase